MTQAAPPDPRSFEPGAIEAPPAIIIHGIGERSGTNYLRWLLACHADVAVSPRRIWEFPHLSHVAPLLDYADRMGRSPKLPGVSRADLLAALGAGLLNMAHAGLPATTRVLLKERSVDNLERFFDFFPSACLVVVVRDGRDVAASLMRTAFGQLGVSRPRRWLSALRMAPPLSALHADRWRQASARIADVTERAAAMPTQRLHVLRYEDLATRREETLRTLLPAIGLDPLCFDWQTAAQTKVRGSSFVGAEDPKQGLNWAGVAAPEYNPVGHWRQWPLRELKAFERVAGAELRRWGYPVSAC